MDTFFNMVQKMAVLSPMKTFYVAILLLASAIAYGEPTTGKIAVIVNKNNTIDSLSQSDIKRIFLKKRKVWHKGNISGSIITVVNQPYTRYITGQFTEKVLEMNINSVKKYWTDQRYKGGELHPEVKHNTQSVINFVEKNKQAVAYTVFAENMLKKAGVKVVATFDIVPPENAKIARAMLESLKFIPGFKKKIKIHVIGDDDISDSFQNYLGEKVNDFEIVSVKSNGHLGEEKPDILFIGRNSNISSTIRYAAEQKILTMTNSSKIFQQGVNLAITLQNNSLKVEHSNRNDISWDSQIDTLERALK